MTRPPRSGSVSYTHLDVYKRQQRFNAADVVAAGGGLLVEDAQVTPEWVDATVVPLAQDRARLDVMATAAAGAGRRDADLAMVEIIRSAVRTGRLS